MLPPIANQSSINYRDAFRPLIALHEDSDIFMLVQRELDKMPKASSSGGIFSTIFASPSQTHSNDAVEKLFRKIIKGWIEQLDQYLETNRYNPIELPELQDSVKPIFIDGKTQILESKLKAANLLSEKTKRSLKKLNAFLLRVLRAPHVSKIAGADLTTPSSFLVSRQSVLMSGLLPMRSIAGLSSRGILFARPGADTVDPEEIHREMIERAHQLQIKRRAKEVSLYNPKWGEGWDEKIVQAIADVDKEKVLKELGSQLSPIQVIVVIQYLLQKPAEDWKLVFVFCSLKTDTLIELLPSLEVSQLYLIKASITRGAEQNREWFTAAVEQQAQKIKDECQLIEDKVNALAERYTEEEQCHLITEKDIQILNELAENLRLRLGILSDKLVKIYDLEIIDESVKVTLFTDTPNRLQRMHTKLTAKTQPDACDETCIWPLIYEKIFVTSDLTDDEESMEILGDWSIIHPKDYWKIGLFGNISIEEFDKLTEKYTLSKLFQCGIANLSHLDIKHISDWKRLEIFNATMLKNYLARKSHAEALKARTLTLLEEST